MGEYINIEERINQINKIIEENSNNAQEITKQCKEMYDQRRVLYNHNEKLETEKQALLARLNQSEIAFKFMSKHKGYTYAGKMDSPEHGYASCNECKVSLELFKGNTGIGEVEIGVCPKCEIEVDFTDYGSW